MKLVEEFIQGKSPKSDLCEDGLFFSSDFAAVIDGATSNLPRDISGKTPGRLAMEIIKESISLLKKEMKAREAIDFISNSLADFYKKNDLYEHLEKHPEDRPTASIVIYSNYYKEIWMVGDAHALVDGEFIENPKIVDEIFSYVRSIYIQSEIQVGVSESDFLKNDEGRKLITPLIERQKRFQNNLIQNEYSYGVIDGFYVPDYGIKVTSIDGAKKIVLSSDGYPKLFPKLEESEKFLSEIIKTDPLCYKENKSTKGIASGNFSYDDRAYLSFIANSSL